MNAGGMFAPEIGRLAGVTVPIIPMAHQYLFSDALEGVHADLPQLRDPDNLVYFREDLGGLLFGGYERHPGALGTRRDPGRLQRPPARARHGAPRRDHGGRRCDASPRSPRPASDASSTGPRRSRRTTSSSSARPRCAASGSRPVSARTASPGRRASAARWRAGSSTASPSSTSGAWTSAGSGPRTGRSATRSPGRPRSTRPTTTSTTRTRSARPGRPLRTSPAYEALAALGAVFGEKSGWERPNWFEPNADDPRFGGRAALEALRPRGWAGRHWSPAIAAEALATRTAAGLFDESSFAKLEVDGPGALAFLQRVGGNDVDRLGRVGRLHPAARPRGAASRPT